MTLDKRWEKVSASIQPAFTGYEDESVPENYLDLMEFLIEVEYKNRIYYSKQLVYAKGIAAQPGLYRLYLEVMVAQVDQHLEDEGHEKEKQ